MMQISRFPARSRTPASLHQLRSALADVPDTLDIRGVRTRSVDHSLHFELERREITSPLMSIWFNVESYQYTLMCRSTIIDPQRPMSDTCARLTEYLTRRAREHGWHYAALQRSRTRTQ